MKGLLLLIALLVGCDELDPEGTPEGGCVTINLFPVLTLAKVCFEGIVYRVAINQEWCDKTAMKGLQDFTVFYPGGCPKDYQAACVWRKGVEYYYHDPEYGDVKEAFKNGCDKKYQTYQDLPRN